MSKKHEYESFCTMCGFPLHKSQIAAVMDDCAVMDYDDRCYVDFSAHLCQECWDRAKENNLGGMDKAMKKLKELQRIDKMDRKRIRR